MERFSKAYDYPYGTSYLSSYTYEPGFEIIENQSFERIIQGEKNMRPFHLSCLLTGKRICFCDQKAPLNNKVNHQFSKEYRKVAYDMHLYYNGFPDETMNRANAKLNFEKERLFNMQNNDYVDTFEKFLDFSDDNASEGGDKRIKTPNNSNSNPSLIYEGGCTSPVSQTINLCSVCHSMITQYDDTAFKIDSKQTLLCTTCK